MTDKIARDREVHLDPQRMYLLALCHVIDLNPVNSDMSWPRGPIQALVDMRWITPVEPGNLRLTALGRREIEATARFGELEERRQKAQAGGGPSGAGTPGTSS